jgi:hypothetical protein
MIKTLICLLISLSSTTLYADSGAYGGRHEIAVDGVYGSFRHVHNWSSPKRIEIAFDMANPDRIFSSDNDFSYVEFIDRQGKVLLREPSPAFTQLGVYDDSYFIGMSDIKSYNPYQLVVWDGNGKIIHKERIQSYVVKFTPKQLEEFEVKFPKAHNLLKPYCFVYQNTNYCNNAGTVNLFDKNAWEYLAKLLVKHPYIYSSESASNYVWWMKLPLEFDKQNNLKVPTQKGEPIVIPLGKPIRLLNNPVGSITKKDN